ncbi:MAG: prepilin-type N-terminal cleavage/methylation domain-containing protein [Candidatus Dormibacterales bacterium]
MDQFFRDRRRAQAGTTLVELLVSLVIIGLALVLIIGTFSTGLLDATIAKRNTAAQAVIQSELDRVSGTPFNPSARSYSECFKTEAADPPLMLPSYQASCPDASYTLRADVSVAAQSPTPTTETWTVSVLTWPEAAPAGAPVSMVKARG